MVLSLTVVELLEAPVLVGPVVTLVGPVVTAPVDTPTPTDELPERDTPELLELPLLSVLVLFPLDLTEPPCDVEELFPEFFRVLLLLWV